MTNELIAVLMALNVSTVHLTFDDGPSSQYTKDVLDILKKNDMKANFFLVGENVKAHPELVEKIVAEGHDIGGHSMTHKELTKISFEAAKREIRDSMILVNEHQPSNLFRFPYGSFNDRLVKYVHELGYINVYWDVDTVDWKYKKKDVIYEKFKVRLSKSPDGSIILMHDVHPQSVEALKLIVAYLKENGVKVEKLDFSQKRTKRSLFEMIN